MDPGGAQWIRPFHAYPCGSVRSISVTKYPELVGKSCTETFLGIGCALWLQCGRVTNMLTGEEGRYKGWTVCM